MKRCQTLYSLKPHLYICLPILNEWENLPNLIQCLKKQSYSNFSLIACVNQPNDWWDSSDNNSICLDNEKSIAYLSSLNNIDITIIDRASRGKGWIGKKKGVGWARKVAMDFAAESGQNEDLIVSIDADTYYPSEYFQSLLRIFNQNPDITAHSNPYYHPLTGEKAEDMAILRYELYMRVYAIQMLLIDNPYAFSAIGSGMATSVFQYKRMGGISPKQSGEDFYFIQKMCKSGRISNDSSIKIFPQARFSNRVNFGTGPAMIKGNAGDWSSYPFYSQKNYLQVKETYDNFSELFHKDINTPMTAFLKKQLDKENIWEPLRKNFKKKHLFVKACTELVDGLRILQFLKDAHSKNDSSDESDFMLSMEYFASHDSVLNEFLQKENFSESLLSFKNMKVFRDILTNIEYKLRKTKAIH